MVCLLSLFFCWGDVIFVVCGAFVADIPDSLVCCACLGFGAGG